MPLFGRSRLPIPAVAPIKVYDLKQVLCTVGGVTISGYGEEDAVRFEWASDIGEEFVTVDGSVLFARSNDRRLRVAITLMQTSSAVPLLAALLETQHGLPAVVAGSLVQPPFYMTDPIFGDHIAGGCIFLNRPLPNKGKVIGEYEFRLLLPDPVWQIGTFNFG